jgi:hypothetical protein
MVPRLLSVLIVTALSTSRHAFYIPSSKTIFKATPGIFAPSSNHKRKTDQDRLHLHNNNIKMGKQKNKKRQQKEAPASDTVAATTTHSHEDSKGSNKRRKRKDKDNPLLKQQQAFLNTLQKVERDSFFSNAAVDPERRAALWMEQADLGEELVNKYSWATPDGRAFTVLRHFDPLIEIGCGSNAYWCRQMIAEGIDIVGYDISPDQGGKIKGGGSTQTDFTVYKGGPEVLALKENANRTLFLCYPDESDDVVLPKKEEDDDDDDEEDDEEEDYNYDNDNAPVSMGAACLEYYQGDYVVHVGELFSDSNLSMDQAPWGRSSSPGLQQRLAAEFHCLLKVSLPNWLHVRDSISVWKRSETCTIVFAADDDDEDGDGEDQEDEEVQYRHIPVEERLPADLAAPCLQHLLRGSSASANEKGESRENKVAAGSKSDAKKISFKEAAPAEGNAKYECPW